MTEETFNPTDYLMKLQGKDYLPVAPRVLWFRKERPIEEGWGIRTELVDGGWGKGYAVFKAEVTYRGEVVATGHAVEVEPVLSPQTKKRVDGFPDYVEKAETSSIGRAVGTAGYGTMGALDEGDVVDAPVGRDIDRHQEGDPEIEELSCANCAAGVDYAYGRSSQRKSGRVLCPRCAGQLEVHTAQPVAKYPEPPAGAIRGCSVCSKPMNEAQQTLSRRKFDGALFCPACAPKQQKVAA